MIIQLIKAESPLPVALRGPRGIHPVTLAEGQNILHRKNGKACDRGQRGLVQDIGHDRGGIPQGSVDVRLLFPRKILKPGHGRVIIMRSGVDDIIGIVVMGKVGVLRTPIKGKLQNEHARNAKTFPERLDFRCDDPKILGNQRQATPAMPGKQGLHQSLTGRLDPVPPQSRLRGSGDLPVGFKSPEVIDPHPVKKVELGFKSIQPPFEPPLRHDIPAVMRVSPPLPGFREIIRGDPRDHAGLPIGQKIKFRLVGPDIGTVAGNKDGDIAKKENPMRVRVAPKRMPLFKKDELLEFNLGDGIFKPGSRRIERRRGSGP